MKISVVLALIGAFLNTGNDFIYRKSAMNGNTKKIFYFYLLSSFSSAVFAFLMCIFINGEFKIAMIEIQYGFLLGVLSYGTYMLFLLSFNGDNTSISVTIYRMNLVPSIILAMVFLNEIMSFSKAIAIGLCITSMLLFSGRSIIIKQNSQYIFLSIGACMMGGILNYFNKVSVLQGTDPFRLLCWRFITVTLVSSLPVIFNKPRVFVLKDIGYPILSGFLLMMGVFCILQSLSTGDISVVIPIVQLSFVLVAIISWLALKEPMNTLKIAGLFCAVLAVVLLK